MGQNCFVKRLRLEQSRTTKYAPAQPQALFAPRGPRRKYFRWGKNAVTYDQVRSLLRKGFFRALHPNIVVSGKSVCTALFGVPAESIFGGADWRDTVSKPLPHRGPRRKHFRWGKNAVTYALVRSLLRKGLFLV